MHSFSIITALSALFATIAAVPVKRDLIVNTVTEYDVVTEYATETVWVDATSTWTATVYQEQFTQPSQAAATTTSAAIVPAVAAAAPTTTSTTTSTSTSTSSIQAPAATTPSTTSPVTVAIATPSTTSVYVAPPEPTTSVYVAPPVTTTSATYVAPAPTTTDTTPVTTTAAAAPATTTAASSGGAQTYTGDITYYDAGLGSCGTTNTNSDMIVAISANLITGNKPAYCGKTITISYGGQTHQATIQDTCPSCATGALDMTPALFKAVAPNGDGRVHDVSWWLN